jgi:hypothetical protein
MKIRNNLVEAVNHTTLIDQRVVSTQNNVVPHFGVEEKYKPTTNFSDYFNSEFKCETKENKNILVKEETATCFKSIVVEQNRKISLSNQIDNINSNLKSNALEKDKEIEKENDKGEIKPVKTKRSIANMIKESLAEDSKIEKPSILNNNLNSIKDNVPHINKNYSSKLEQMLNTDSIKDLNSCNKFDNVLDSNNKGVSRYLNFQDISISDAKIPLTPNNNKSINQKLVDTSNIKDEEKIFDLSTSKIEGSVVKDGDKRALINETEIKEKDDWNTTTKKNFLSTPPKGSSKQAISLFDSFGKNI